MRRIKNENHRFPVQIRIYKSGHSELRDKKRDYESANTIQVSKALHLLFSLGYECKTTVLVDGIAFFFSLPPVTPELLKKEVPLSPPTADWRVLASERAEHLVNREGFGSAEAANILLSEFPELLGHTWDGSSWVPLSTPPALAFNQLLQNEELRHAKNRNRFVFLDDDGNPYRPGARKDDDVQPLDAEDLAKLAKQKERN